MAVYAWPPVGLSSFPVWRENAPKQRSVSAITGKPYISTHQRRRIMASYSVSARLGNVGAGYMHALIRLLNRDDDGENYVRLYHRRFTPITGRTDIVRWYAAGAPMTWDDGSGSPVTWYTGTPAEGTVTTDGGFPAVSVTGLPASALVSIPGEFVTMGGETRTALQEVRSDASGAAVIRVHQGFTAPGAVVIGDCETGIFEVLDMPSGGGPIDLDYTYDWRFRQVFTDEIGDQDELTPWW